MTLKVFAKNMRATPTDVGAILWQQLRAHRFSGHKFKRQQPLGNYIVDFVCFDSKIVVEADGGQHGDANTDVIRDEWLKSQGFFVLRFWNHEVLQNLEGVLTRILETLAPSLQRLSHEGREAKGGARRTTQERVASKDLHGDSKRPASLPPREGGSSGEFAPHAVRRGDGDRMQSVARPARSEGEGAAS